MIFLVDYDSIDFDDTLDIHKYLTKKTRYKIKFSFIKKYLLDYEALAQWKVFVSH